MSTSDDVFCFPFACYSMATYYYAVSLNGDLLYCNSQTEKFELCQWIKEVQCAVCSSQSGLSGSGWYNTMLVEMCSTSAVEDRGPWPCKLS